MTQKKLVISRLDSSAFQALKMLRDEYQVPVATDVLQETETGTITAETIFEMLCRRKTSVKELLRMLRPGLMKLNTDLESKSARFAAERTRRTVADLIAGMRDTTMCMQLGEELKLLPLSR